MAPTSRPDQPTIPPRGTPLVVQYLYVHGPGEAYEYPSSRAQAGAGQLAARYLECVLVQAASLRLRGTDCRLALVTNLADRRVLTGHGARLLGEIEALGVELMFAEYLHRPPHEVTAFASSRYVLDAILAATADADPDAQLWLTDVDCVWFEPERVFAASPPSPALGCVHIEYPPDWDVNGTSPRMMGELAGALGASGDPIRWVGGELLSGSAADLRLLVTICEQLESEIADRVISVATEEQLFSLAEALGRVSFQDISQVARRIWTGPRHGAHQVADPEKLGLWHLPSEKGLGFRRAAREISSGHPERLQRDLEDPGRAMARFNVLGAGWTRRVRDDAWLGSQRLRARLPARRV